MRKGLLKREFRPAAFLIGRPAIRIRRNPPKISNIVLSNRRERAPSNYAFLSNIESAYCAWILISPPVTGLFT